MTKKELKQELLNASVEIDLQGHGKADVIFERDFDNLIYKLLILYNVKLSLFQKNRLDLLNWAKSELKQETNTKLGKTMTPYRSDKIIFLRRIIDWLNNEA